MNWRGGCKILLRLLAIGTNQSFPIGSPDGFLYLELVHMLEG